MVVGASEAAQAGKGQKSEAATEGNMRLLSDLAEYIKAHIC